MNETQIKWLGLRTNRERTIYIEAFWDGVNSTDNLKKQVIERETNWAIEKNDRAAVPRTSTKANERDVVVGWCR